MARHLVGGSPPTAEMFTDLFRLASRFELAIPAEIATVLRALATLEGTLSLLTPGIDIAAEARPVRRRPCGRGSCRRQRCPRRPPKS